jgi:glycosyltransferase involved in cell wall biosynthesis
VYSREENPYRPCFAIRHQPVQSGFDMYFVNHPQGKDGYRHPDMDEGFGRLLDLIKPDIAHVGHLNHLSTGLLEQLYQRHIPIVFTLHDFWLMCPRGQFLQRTLNSGHEFHLCTGQDDFKCATTCYNMYFGGRHDGVDKDLDYWTDWIRRRMEETRSVAQLVDYFIAPSEYLRRRFIDEFGLPESKVIYLDYGFPLEYLTPRPAQRPERPFTFGYIGTHIPAKGVNLLIEAFSRLRGKARLLIFGRDNG